MAFKAVDPTTKAPSENSGKASPETIRLQREALSVLSGHIKHLKEANRQWDDLAKVAKPTVKAMSDFVKTIDKLKTTFKKLEYEVKVNSQASSFKIGGGSGLATRQGFFESISSGYNQQLFMMKMRDDFVRRASRTRISIDKLGSSFRGGISSLYNKWMREDISSVRPTTGLSGGGGRTTPLARPPAGIKNLQGRITEELTQNVTQSLIGHGATLPMSRPPAGILRRLGKVTTEIAQSVITQGLLAGGTMPMKQFAFISKAGVRPTSAFSVAGATTSLRGAAYAQTTPLYPQPLVFPPAIHPAGMLPSLPSPPAGPPPSRRGGFGGAVGAYGLYRTAKGVWAGLGEGADYDLSVWRQLLMASTNLPQMDFTGGGISGLKSRTGTFGGPRSGMGAFGPVTPAELYAGLYGKPELSQALTYAGVNVAEWPRVFGVYGARGGIQKAILSSASASQDLDLGYKDFWDWLGWSGKMQTYGYAGNNGERIGGMLSALRGTVQAGGAANIPKPVIDQTVNSVIDELSRTQSIANPKGLTSFVGGIMGGTIGGGPSLPSLRTGESVISGLSGINSAMGNIVNNPYLFTIIGQMYASANKGSNIGTPSGWINTLGPVAKNMMPLLESVKGLPMEQQIAILNSMHTFSSDEATQRITGRFKSMFSNKGLGMYVERNVLSAAGVNPDDINPLLYSEWFGSPAGTKPIGVMGADRALWSKRWTKAGPIGDVDALTAAATTRGYSTMAKGTLASDLAEGISAISVVGIDLNKSIVRLIEGIENLANKLPGTTIRVSTGAPLPVHGPPRFSPGPIK